MPRAADPDAVLDGLDPEQRSAAALTRGPVCILAGAGTGKTTTVTHRIAYQVATGAFAPGEILAVTFTDRAAGELRERLAALGVRGVRARTFHATALAQLGHLVPELGRVLPSKAELLAPIVSRLHRAYRFRPLAEFAGEIEWAKNRRLGPAAYESGLGGRVPPFPPDLVVRVFREYERRKEQAGRIDFEDVLGFLVARYEEHPEDAARFRRACRAITVDEYQDVNLLQQSLLELWLGDRDDLCAVGDDYQAIFSFTGATPAYLLGMRDRFPGVSVVRLERNYRSTPQVLSLANRLVPSLGGEPRELRAIRDGGPEPLARPFESEALEVAWLVDQVGRLVSAGVALEDVAVLVRVNSRSDDLEGALAEAGIAYRVRGGSFLERPAARAVTRLLRGRGALPAGEAVRAAAIEAGLLEVPPDGLDGEGRTYQDDLRRLAALAGSVDVPVAAFLADLDRRFRGDGGTSGLQILTYHRAKGLEFEAVFLPFLVEGELPARQAKTEQARAEERRLLYVGITRARAHLALSWAGRPSPFLAELGVAGAAPAGTERSGRTRSGATRTRPAGEETPAFTALRAWRRERARADEVPAFVVFGDAALQAIAEERPATLAELALVRGVGPAKLERYGADVLAVLARV